MTLDEFLLARIADEEAGCRKLLRYAQENELAVGDPKMLGRYIPGWHEWPAVQALCTRVLAECEAKRAIVANHLSYLRSIAARNEEGLPVNAIERDVRIQRYAFLHLAAVYADHPDYQQEWRP